MALSSASVTRFWATYSDSADWTAMPRASIAACSLPKSAKRAADDRLRLALVVGPLAHLFQAVVDEVQLQRLEVLAGQRLGRQAEDAHALELERDAPLGPHRAAVGLEGGAHVGDGADDVVGRGLDHDGDAVGRVALVHDDVVVLRALPRRLLDRVFDLVLGHVRGARVLNHAAQRGIAVRARPAGLHGDGDVLADAGERLGHLVPPLEHGGLACLEDASHDEWTTTRDARCASLRRRAHRRRSDAR